MSYKDKYLAMISEHGGSVHNIRFNTTKRKILSAFEDSLSYYEVIFNDDLLTRGVHIVDSSDSDSKDKKKIAAKPNEPLETGDYLLWDSSKWMVGIVDNMGGIYKRGNIYKCASSIKWIRRKQIFEAPFFIRKDYSGLGIEEGKIITIGSELRYISIQNNKDTRQIVAGNRFIFDNRAWSVTAIESLSVEGLINLTLQEEQFNTKDNLELRIADYYSQKDFNVKLLNPTNNVSVGSTYQLNIQVYYGDELLQDAVPTYSSSNDKVASISSTGLITAFEVGLVEIVISYADVTYRFTLNIEAVIVDDYTIVFETQPLVFLNQTKTFTVHFKNNGQPYDDSATFKLLGDDDKPTTLATIQSTELNKCAIKAGSKIGYVRLYVSNSNNTVSDHQRIQIKAIL